MRTRIFHLATETDDRDDDDFPIPAKHRLVALACLDLDLRNRKVSLSGTHVKKQPEAEIVSSFFKGLPETDKTQLPSLISWCGRNFALPVLLSRAIAYDLDASLYLQNGYNHRFSPHHFDACDWSKWTLCGGRGGFDLNSAAALIGLPPRIVLNIAETLRKGDYGSVLARVGVDVLIITLFWLRAEHIGCNITLADYQEMKERILHAYRGKSKMFDEYLKRMANV